MARRYSAFLVRCWHLANGEQRYVIEEIGTDAATRLATFAELCAWLATRVGEE